MLAGRLVAFEGLDEHFDSEAAWAFDRSVASAEGSDTAQETLEICNPLPLSPTEAIPIQMLAEHTRAAQEDAALPPDTGPVAVLQPDAGQGIAKASIQIADIAPLNRIRLWTRFDE